MKVMLAIWLAVTLATVVLALWWGHVTRPRLHLAPAPGSPLRAACPCPVCGHIPYFEAPDCTRCGGMGFISTIEDTQHG